MHLSAVPAQVDADRQSFKEISRFPINEIRKQKKARISMDSRLQVAAEPCYVGPNDTLRATGSASVAGCSRSPFGLTSPRKSVLALATTSSSKVCSMRA